MSGRSKDDATVVDACAGRLVLENCDVSGGGIGVLVRGPADPHVRRCHIHQMSGLGLCAIDDGAGVFEDNEITGSIEANFTVGAGGNPTVRGNRMTRSQGRGVWFQPGSNGTFENNTVTDNRDVDWDATGNARCKIRQR
jgi:F-box protein 11